MTQLELATQIELPIQDRQSMNRLKTPLLPHFSVVCLSLTLFCFSTCSVAQEEQPTRGNKLATAAGNQGISKDQLHQTTDSHGNHEHHQGIFTTRENFKTLPLAKSDDCFHIVIYGDRTGGVPAGLKVLEQAVKDTNLLDPDLVMTVGDLIQGYNQTPEWMAQMKEFHAIMDHLKMKWYPVAGNHDVYWRGQGETPDGHHEKNYEKHFGPLWYSFRHKNAGFVVLYSDEGNRKTNRKGFNRGDLQNMSKEQLDFLDQALADLQDLDHVMVFLHHPRWIGGGYSGNNWDEVHNRLKKAGNVSAVFAGHIHRMRYEGPRDGIDYFALATTGGHLSADFPNAGYLHHFNVVTVRKDRVTVAAIPVGGVIDPKDFTKEFLAEIDQARSIRPIVRSKKPLLDASGKVEGEVVFNLTNPCPRPMDITVAFEPPRNDTNWSSNLGHRHLTLEAGDTRDVRFRMTRREGQAEQAGLPRIQLNAEYLGESARIKIPESNTPVSLALGQVPTNHFRGAVNRALDVVSANGAIAVEAKSVGVPDGPMTLEAWVKPKSLNGYNAIIAKTEGSEYGLYSDEGVPQFDIHLGGRYVTAKAKEKLVVDQWSHIAGVYDGQQVQIYVNGKLAGTQKGTGPRRTNSLPLYIGADPDRRALPSRPMMTMIDEVRLSKSARYAASFAPAKRHEPDAETVLLMHMDRNIGPFLLDHSPSASKGILGRESRFVPANR